MDNPDVLVRVFFQKEKGVGDANASTWPVLVSNSAHATTNAKGISFVKDCL